jgi:hypothetical protein
MIKSALQSSLTNDVKYRSMSAGAVPSSEYLIATTVLTQNEPSVTFDNLGQFAGVYKHLQLIASVSTSLTAGGDDQLRMRFNGDAVDTNYRAHTLYGFNNSVSSEDTQSYNRGFAGYVATAANANSFGAVVIDILDAFNTGKNKTSRTFSGFASGSLPIVGLYSHLWMNTAAINSITISQRNGTQNLIQNSRFSLYGVTA